MKRSEINNAIAYALEALERIQFCLPVFAYWSMEEWREQREKLGAIREVMLGWDVTDFGTEDFIHTGAVLFTIRNGSLHRPETGVPYCEKVIVFRDQVKQVIPLHFHRKKTEDIINRGNGVLEIELFHAGKDGKPDPARKVDIFMDGIKHEFNPGELIEIYPGNSITLPPGIYHRFGCKKGAGALVAGEVSKINDDNTDNVFANGQERFSSIEEDEERKWPLVNEYGLLYGV